MEMPTKCQVAKAVFLLILLLFIPVVSSSSRLSYLYFLLDILIVALGSEAGFLRAISGPHDSKRTPSTAPAAAADAGIEAREGVPHGALRPAMAMRKTAVVVKKGLTSKPSIFFIAGGSGGREEGSGVRKEEIKWEGEGEMSKQELFAKAENFIGNLYMQLRLQREGGVVEEDSWIL